MKLKSIKINAYYEYETHVIDIISFLEKLKENNIVIFKLNKIDKYTYRFYCSYKYKRKLLELYKDVKLISKKGYLHSIFSFLKYKTTLIALVISIAFYLSISSKIWKIEIVGDTDNLNTFINEQLRVNNIYVGANKLDVNELAKIQNDILYNNYEIIEYLSIKEEGCAIKVSFKKKRKEGEINQFKGSLYASKDGVIKSFDLLSGEKVVSVNDYVKKGDLLVKDIVTTDYNNEVYVGTFGSVYAYTWYYVTINEKISYTDKESVFANCLLAIKEEICKNFTDNEYIYEENVLKFNIDKNILNMKVHFTCVEDIAKE